MKVVLLLLVAGSDAFVVLQKKHNIQERRLKAVQQQPQGQKEVGDPTINQWLQTAARLRKEASELEKQLVSEADLDALFSVADVNRDGHVTRTALKGFLKRKLVVRNDIEKAHVEELVEDDEVVEHVFQDLDANRDGTLEREDWVSLTEFRNRLDDWWSQFHPSKKIANSPFMHPAIAAHQRTEKRLQLFEERANETGLAFRLMSFGVYALPALEMGRLTEKDLPFLKSLSDSYFDVPFLCVFALIILFNVAIEYRVPRLLRFHARHALILDLLGAIFLAPAIKVLGTTDATTWASGLSFLAKYASSHLLPVSFELLLVACAINALQGQTTAFVPLTGSLAEKMTHDCDQEIYDVIKQVSITDDDIGIHKKDEEETTTEDDSPPS